MPTAALTPETAVRLTVLWLVVLGGVFGSFFNVVIHRLPQGMSLIRPGSHCPACNKPIRWYDNVPVLGWMVLRGRCRDCNSPISVWYPLVEAATAAMFGVLAKVELLSGGANLPPAIYAYHLTLLCTLMCAALIELDGKRLPLRLFTVAAAVGLLAPIVWPRLHPLPAWSGSQGPLGGFVDGVIGLACGAVLGGALWWAWKRKRQTGAMPAAACAGLFLGWQAALVLALATATAVLLLALVGRALPAVRRVPPSAVLAVLAFGWVLFWEPLVRLGGGG